MQAKTEGSALNQMKQATAQPWNKLGCYATTIFTWMQDEVSYLNYVKLS
jgi:predicted ATPase